MNQNPGIVSSGLPVSITGTVNTKPVGLSGASSSGSILLNSTNTWFQFPDSGNVPASTFELVISKEIATGVLRFSFTNSSSPSSTFGNIYRSSDITFTLAANQVVYIASTVNTDRVNWITKIV